VEPDRASWSAARPRETGLFKCQTISGTNPSVVAAILVVLIAAGVDFHR
jgi:hypothetical protein